MPSASLDDLPHSTTAVESANDTLATLRLSIDEPPTANGTTPAKTAMVNGQVTAGPTLNGTHGTSQEDAEQLRAELDKTRQEKDTLALQYNSLLAKLQTMRNTLGKKLQEDAEELDRREQAIHTLTAQNHDLASTLSTLESELVVSNEEAERASRELEALRSRLLEDNAQEVSQREQEARELQMELERCRMERDEWERAAMQERVVTEDLRSREAVAVAQMEMMRIEKERESGELQKERENSANLQSVLEDFQAAKDAELRQAVAEQESRTTELIKSLAEYKSRALQAEVELSETTTSSRQVQELEREVKEKTLLIGKLRHEGVIMNEHLTEALRRLRKNSSDIVDRRVVTNILLQFLTTPRGDAKRFEMLNLLASILSWTDPEREKAGLQRSGVNSAARSTSSSPARGTTELGKTDETETFSKMWVEFLLKESAQGQAPSAVYSSAPSPALSSNTSLPGSPTVQSPGGANAKSPTLRVPSLNLSGMIPPSSSVPNLNAPPLPRNKGTL